MDCALQAPCAKDSFAKEFDVFAGNKNDFATKELSPFQYTATKGEVLAYNLYHQEVHFAPRQIKLMRE